MQPSEFRLVSRVEDLPEPSAAALQFIAAWKAARGERVNASWGGPIAGKTSREILGEADAPVIEAIWHSILTTPLLHYGNAERLSANLLYAAERVVVPLADDAGNVNIVLGLSRYSLGGLSRITAQAILANAVHIRCCDL